MSSMTGVQLRGVDAVLTAYDNIKIIAWSVMYGKNVNMKYVGKNWTEARAGLQAFLEQLRESQTTAVYTLCIFEDVPKDGKIRSTSEADYAFNFLVDESEPPRFARYREGEKAYTDLQNKIVALEAKLAARELEDEDDDEPQGIGAILSGLAKDPAVMEWIKTKAIGLADQFLKLPSPNNNSNVIPMNQRPSKIGGITESDPILINEDQQLKVQQAIEVLARCDSALGDNLLKIAAIAQNDPTKYQMFSKML